MYRWGYPNRNLYYTPRVILGHLTFLYTVKAQTSRAPLSRFRGSLVTTAHAHQCCRFQSYAKTVPSRMKLTMKLTKREPHCWDLWQRTTWSRHVTSDFNSVLILEIWRVYHFVCYDLQMNLAHELLVYLCVWKNGHYNISIGICRSAVMMMMMMSWWHLYCRSVSIFFPSFKCRINNLCKQYEDKFQSKPSFLARASGRVNLIGKMSYWSPLFHFPLHIIMPCFICRW